MLKRILPVLLALSLLYSQAFAAAVWFPDPGPAFGVEGVFDKELEHSVYGKFHQYIYDFRATIADLADYSFAYQEAMVEMGYKCMTVDDESAIFIYHFYDGDVFAEIGAYAIDDFEALSIGNEGLLRMYFVVPADAAFILGVGVPGVVAGFSTCDACNGTGKCSYCGGSGRANYGAGYETCVICDGTRICNICDGEGGR